MDSEPILLPSLKELNNILIDQPLYTNIRKSLQLNNKGLDSEYNYFHYQKEFITRCVNNVDIDTILNYENNINQLIDKPISISNIKSRVSNLKSITNFIKTNNLFDLKNTTYCKDYPIYEIIPKNTIQNYKDLFFDFPSIYYYLLLMADLYIKIHNKDSFDKDILELNIFDYKTSETIIDFERLDTILKQYYYILSEHYLLNESDELNNKINDLIDQHYDFLNILKNELLIIRNNIIKILKTKNLTNDEIKKITQVIFTGSYFFLDNTFNKQADVLYYFGYLFSRLKIKTWIDENVLETDFIPLRKIYMTELDNGIGLDFKNSVKIYFDITEDLNINKIQDYIDLSTEHKKKFIYELFNIQPMIPTYNSTPTLNSIKINSIVDVSNHTVFYEQDLTNADISNNLDLYKKTHIITYQYYSQIKNILTPYIFEVPLQFDSYPIENGFNTGPTKQVMNYFNNLLNYIIFYKNGELIFKTPKWVTDKNTKDFYIFLTHYIIQDIKHVKSKFVFNLPFHMFIPTLVECANYGESTLLNQLVKEFKLFIKLPDIDLLDSEGRPKYEGFKDANQIIKYYNIMCLYLIDDLLEGGNQYTYLIKNPETLFYRDEDTDFVKQKLSTHRIPDGFFSISSLLRLNIDITKIPEMLFFIFSYIKSQTTITSELFLSKIKFYGIQGQPQHNYILDYMKDLITNFTSNIQNPELVKNIQEIYPTQEKFLDQLLMVWTASNNITDDTEIKMYLENQGVIAFTTCHNTFVYPIPRGAAVERISFDDFVNNVMGIMAGTGFGLRGGKKKTIRKKKTIKKKNNIKSHTKKNKKTRKYKKY